MNTPKEPKTDNKFGIPKEEFRSIETTGNKKWLRITLLVAGVVLLTGSAIVWWLLNNTLRKKDNLFYHFQASKNEKIGKNSTLDLDNSYSVDDDLMEDLKDLSKGLTNKQHEIATPTIETINAPTGLYHIIVASCIDHDLIMDYAKKLVTKGFSSKIIASENNKHFVRLSIAQTKTWKEASIQMNELKSEFGNNIWILKY
jgi:hypothetical protein